jgi:hypothetical protein
MADEKPDEKHYVTTRYGNFIQHDLGRMMSGDYYYTVCTSRFLVGIRRRFFPRTLRYEERYQPPITLTVPTFPLWNMLPRVPAPGIVHQFQWPSSGIPSRDVIEQAMNDILEEGSDDDDEA